MSTRLSITNTSARTGILKPSLRTIPIASVPLLVPGNPMVSYVSRGIIGSNTIYPLLIENSCSIQMIEITAVSSDRNP